MADFSKVLDQAARSTCATWPVIEVRFQAPDGGTATITVKPEHLAQESFRMPGPAELDPASPEASVVHFFKDDYGDGSLIMLNKNDPQFAEKAQAFAEKAQALRESDRRFDKSAGGWVKKK